MYGDKLQEFQKAKDEVVRLREILDYNNIEDHGNGRSFYFIYMVILNLLCFYCGSSTVLTAQREVNVTL